MNNDFSTAMSVQGVPTGTDDVALRDAGARAQRFALRRFFDFLGEVLRETMIL